MSRKITIDTLFTFTGMILFQIVNFFVAVFISRFSGVDSLGAYQFFIVTTTFFGFFAKMGIDEKLTYNLPYLGGVKNKKSKILIFKSFSKVLWMSLFSAFGTILFYKIMSLYSETKIDIYDSLFSLAYLPLFSLGILIGAIFRSENFIKKRVLLIYLVPTIVTGLLLFFFIYVMKLNKNTILAMRTISYALMFLLGCKWLFDSFKINLISLFKYFSLKTLIKTDSTIYKWLGVAMITFLLESGTIGLWLMRLLSDEYNVGVISILLRLTGLTYLAPTAMGIVFGPLIAKKNANNEEFTVLKTKMLLFSILLVSFVSLFVYFFSNQILELFGKAIGSYSTELIYLLFGTSAIAITQPLQSMALAINGLKKVFAISLIAGVFSLIVFLSFEVDKSVLQAVKAISASMLVYGSFRFLYLLKSIKTNNIN
ncbi:MAG: hypothetical protein P8H93_00555 [Polaribacter sp.]|jgi:O-antigen/teichoic acid export membrane protein|nr:hypothetical protein [Polaribacter sp.]